MWESFVPLHDEVVEHRSDWSPRSDHLHVTGPHWPGYLPRFSKWTRKRVHRHFSANKESLLRFWCSREDILWHWTRIDLQHLVLVWLFESLAGHLPTMTCRHSRWSSENRERERFTSSIRHVGGFNDGDASVLRFPADTGELQEQQNSINNFRCVSGFSTYIRSQSGREWCFSTDVPLDSAELERTSMAEHWKYHALAEVVWVGWKDCGWRSIRSMRNERWAP